METLPHPNVMESPRGRILETVADVMTGGLATTTTTKAKRHAMTEHGQHIPKRKGLAESMMMRLDLAEMVIDLYDYPMAII